MKNNFILAAGISGAAAVALGAFAAHGLKPLMSSADYGIFKTGSEYHFYHSILLFGIGILSAVFKEEKRMLNFAGGFLLAGIILFSGSLYLLSVREVLETRSFSWLGPLTPLGGLCFIVGWILIGVYGIRLNKTSV